MRFVFEPALTEYMKKKKKTVLCVEVASSDHSDIEIAEIYLRLADDRFAAYLLEKKRYREMPAEGGRVLLTPYRLSYDETVTFSLKKQFFFHRITFDGIRL